MKFKFIGNACGTFIGSKGTKLLCDPWIVDGVFEGSWYHYPPLKTKIQDLHDVDCIYVSHIHPDHYDERYFNFRKDMPIVILDGGSNFLKKKLLQKGYKNLIDIKDDETKKFKEFELTVYKPFSGHIFEESLIGNLIDSAIAIKDQNNVALNFNDNTPDEKACIKIKEKFKRIDLAMLNYNAAGPYPSCFENLNNEEKKKENNRILNRNFEHLCKIIPLLNPSSVLPFAGSYIIGGKNYEKNNYLGTTTWDECSDYLKKELKDTNIICLRENQIFDIKKQKSEQKYIRLCPKEMREYIKKIKDKRYVYELDKKPDFEKLKKDILIAKKKLKERLERFDIKLKSNLF